MMTIFLIVAVDRWELREHIQKHRQLEYSTRMEAIKYYCQTQCVYAVMTLADALVECRAWNSRHYSTVHYWEAVSLCGFEEP